MNRSSFSNGAEALLEFLRIQETDFIFCSPIGILAPLWEALAKRDERGELVSPKYLNCRHELLAVGLASGFYKATGRPQVVLLSPSFGVLNGSMGIWSAMQERIPMVILTPDTMTYGTDPTLDAGIEWPSLLVDIGGSVRDAEAFVKWGKESKTANSLVADLRRAFYFAETVPRGPTLLSVPYEILMTPLASSIPPKLEARPVVAPIEQIRQMSELLTRSLNPVIITERAGRTSIEVNTLVKLAELIGAPVFEFWLPSFQNFPRSHPLHGNGPVEAVLPEADCIIVAGANGPWHPPLVELKDGCKVIVFEEDPLRPRAPYWGYQTDYCVAGDIGMNLAQLCAELEKHIVSLPTERIERWKQYNHQTAEEKCNKNKNDVAQSRSRIHASTLFQALHRALPEGSAIVDEILSQEDLMLKVLFQSKPFKQYRGWAGALGTGLPTALGVKLALPDNLVVCITGDGGFNYNPVPACFGLAQQHKVPILVVICNNEGCSWRLLQAG
jgi:acetolactate synthase-1/2/3 large subunit